MEEDDWIQFEDLWKSCEIIKKGEQWAPGHQKILNYQWMPDDQKLPKLNYGVQMETDDQDQPQDYKNQATNNLTLTRALKKFLNE